MAFFIRCVTGPRVFRLYKTGDREGHLYEENILELYSDKVLRTASIAVSIAWSLGFYVSPLLASYMYRKGYFTGEGLYNLSRLTGTLGLILLGAVCLRGLGRRMNNDYITFLTVLDAYKKSMTRNLKYELSRFDFEFREWPVDFRWNETQEYHSKPKMYLDKTFSKRQGVVEKVRGLPCDMLSYIAIHTFGRRMIYPGSVSVLKPLFDPMLRKGRAHLIEDCGGERNKLLTIDGNEIDSIFIDRRHKSNFPNGKYLVICCEGNSGFYEYGITTTPVEAGYSVLGWNHPGFGSSTGIPFPDQETNAVDAVVQFAIHKLRFKPEDIIIYAWSIGGYSATWAAMNYPDVKGLVLDATFDDLVPLALARMPPSWRGLVVRTIRDYMDLNNGEQLCRYKGPVLLVRRVRDEMISTKASRSLQTNRGNDLLIKLLQNRYPKLVTEDTLWALKDWISGDRTHQAVVWSQQGVEEELCQASLASYIEENSAEFPMSIGEDMPTDMKVQLVLYLAQKHMIDFDSTHCVPLPARLFQIPWDPTNATRSEFQVQEDSCP